MASRRYLSAIMFTDMVGFTRLMGEDEQMTLKLIRTNRQIHKTIIKKHSGKWLKEMGDGTLASFRTISDAVYCAGKLISECKKHDIELRIGIHFGEVTTENEDIFGDGVNVASRIESLAAPGQILVSESIYRNVINKYGILGSFFKEAKLKNVEGSVRVYKLEVDTTFEPVLGPRYVPYLTRKSIVIAVLFAIAILIIYSISNYFAIDLDHQENILEKSIAVLPFEVLSADEEDEYLAKGVKEAVEFTLSGIAELIVSTPNATEQYHNTNKPIREVARELGVRFVLWGSVQRYKDTFRITPRIYDFTHEKIIWQDQYTESVDDFFNIIDHVAIAASSQLHTTITPVEQIKLEERPTSDFTAYDLYMRGRSYFGNHLSQWNLEDLLIAESFYKQALEIDSSFALGYVGLGNIAKFKRGDYGFPSSPQAMEYTDSMKIYATRAISLDPKLAEAYALRGDYYSWTNQYDKAISDLEKALSIKPNLSEAYFTLGRIWMEKFQNPVKAFQYLFIAEKFEKNGILLPNILYYKGSAYGMVGDVNQAEKTLRMCARLSPGAAGLFQPVVTNNLFNGRFDKAEYLLDSAAKILDDDWHYYYAMLYTWTNRPEKALKALIGTTEINVEDEHALLKNKKSKLDHLAAYNLSKLGYQNLANQVFEMIVTNLVASNNADFLPEIYAEMGEYEKSLNAMIELEKKNPYHSIFILSKHIPSFEPIRNDPRYIDLIEKVDQRKALDRQRIRGIEMTNIADLMAE
jgi:adenylate cyclase